MVGIRQFALRRDNFVSGELYFGWAVTELDSGGQGLPDRADFSPTSAFGPWQL